MNAAYFRDRLDELAESKGKHLKLIVLDAESINRMDSTGVEMLKERIDIIKKGIFILSSWSKRSSKRHPIRSKILEVIEINLSL